MPRRHHPANNLPRLPMVTPNRRPTPTQHIGASLGCPTLLTLIAFRAQYGYDVNSPQFKEWAASQQAQYGQYWAQQGYAGDAPAPPAPAPTDPSPPPPPPA